MEQRPIRADHNLRHIQDGRSHKSPSEVMMNVMIQHGRPSPNSTRKSPSDSRTPSPSLSKIAAAERRSPSQSHSHNSASSRQLKLRNSAMSPETVYLVERHEERRPHVRSSSLSRSSKHHAHRSSSVSRAQEVPKRDKHHGLPRSHAPHVCHGQGTSDASTQSSPRSSSACGLDTSHHKVGSHSRSASAENPTSCKRISPSQTFKGGPITLDDQVLLNPSRHSSDKSQQSPKNRQELQAIQAQLRAKVEGVIASSISGSVQHSGRRNREVNKERKHGASSLGLTSPSSAHRSGHATVQTVCDAVTQVNFSDEEDYEKETQRAIYPRPCEREPPPSSLVNTVDAEVSTLGFDSFNNDSQHSRKHSSPSSTTFSKNQSPSEALLNNLEQMNFEEIEMLERVIQSRKSQLLSAHAGSRQATSTPLQAWPPQGYTDKEKGVGPLSPSKSRHHTSSQQTGGESAAEQRTKRAGIKGSHTPLPGINENSMDSINFEAKAHESRGHGRSSSSRPKHHRTKERHRREDGAESPNMKMFTSAFDEEIKRLFQEYGGSRSDRHTERALKELMRRHCELERMHSRRVESGLEDPYEERHSTHGKGSRSQTGNRRHSLGAPCSGGHSQRSSSPSSSLISSEGMSCVMVSPRSPNHIEFGYQPPPSFVPRIKLEALRSPRGNVDDLLSPDLSKSIEVLSSPRSAFTPRSYTSNSSTSTPRPPH